MSYSKSDAEIVRIYVEAGSPNRALIALGLRTPARTFAGMAAALSGVGTAIGLVIHFLSHIG
jgi:hypothetical protein